MLSLELIEKFRRDTIQQQGSILADSCVGFRLDERCSFAVNHVHIVSNTNLSIYLNAFI